MSPITWMDIVIACAMMLFFAHFVKRTRGYIAPYFVVPSLLVWVHVIFNALQENQVGPVWMQDYFHDVGVATCGLIVLIFVSVLKGDGRSPCRGLTKTLMNASIAIHFFTTICCILAEVYVVTIDRETSLVQGYSGELDTGDVLAFVVGFVIMAINHVILKRHILRRMKRAGDIYAV